MGGTKGKNLKKKFLKKKLWKNFFGFFFFFFSISKKDKSCNRFKFVSVLLSASVERVGVSRMRDFFTLILDYGRVKVPMKEKTDLNCEHIIKRSI